MLPVPYATTETPLAYRYAGTQNRNAPHFETATLMTDEQNADQPVSGRDSRNPFASST